MLSQPRRTLEDLAIHVVESIKKASSSKSEKMCYIYVRMDPQMKRLFSL